MNNNEQDNYCWIQLAARTEVGKTIRNGYVQFDNNDAINRWRRKFNNTDVFRSICVYAKPSHRARFVAPLFFYVRPQGDFAQARAKTIDLEESLLVNLDAPCRSVEIYLDGDGTFELVMSHEVFQPVYSPHIFAVNKEFAEILQGLHLRLVDTSVYSETHLWRFPNSRSSRTGLYKIPLSHEELLDAGQDELIEMTRSPRTEDNYAYVIPGEFADYHYQERIQEQEQKSMRCPVCESTGREMPIHEKPLPCIQTFETSGLPDGTRYKTYLLLASYFAYLHMHYDQIVRRLSAIDAMHPIRDPAYIEKAAEFGCRHPGPLACTDPTLMRYCQKDECHLAHSDNLKRPYLDTLKQDS
jgi:hypothetical protein